MKNTERQQTEMKKQTIGVEVEMNNITRKDAARIAAEYFGTGRCEDTAYRNGYYSWSAWDAQGREWKFQRDVSIAGDDAHKCEMVTPILTYGDIETLQELCRRLRKAGAKSDATRGCGVHIHIGVGDHTPQSLRNLANLMASHEKILISALNISQSRIGTYCKTVDPNFLAEVNKKKPKTMNDLKNIWYGSQNATHRQGDRYNNSRYHCLNLHAVFTKGTIEFRLFQFRDRTDTRRGGIHCGELKSYIQLCLALSEMAKRLKTASPKEPQYENPKYAMRCWLLRLGLIGNEFKTARGVLTKNLAGDAAFRYGRNNSLLMVGVGQ